MSSLPAALLNLPLPRRGHLQSGETYPQVRGMAGLAGSSGEWGRQEGLWKKRPLDVGWVVFSRRSGLGWAVSLAWFPGHPGVRPKRQH